MAKLSCRTVRGFVLISSGFLGFGPCYLFCAVFSLQELLITPPCPLDVVPSSNCCASCLGFSTFEYDLLIGLPLLVSALAGLFAGAIIDRYGCRALTISASLALVFGCACRALACRPLETHLHQLLLFLFGNTVVDSVYSVVFVVQLHTCARWFSGPFLPFLLGVITATSLLGAVLAFCYNFTIASHMGLETTMWLSMPAAAVSIFFAVVLAVLDRVAEREHYNFQSVANLRVSMETFAALRRLSSRFWLVTTIIALAWLLSYAFLGNAEAFQVIILKETSQVASVCAGLLLITKILLAPLAGLVAAHFALYGSVSVLGSLFNLVALALLFFEAGPPLLTLIFLGTGFALCHTVMASVLQGLVPFEALGVANGVMNAAICAAIGLGDVAIGLSVRGGSARAWRSSAAFLLSMAGLQMLAILVFLIADYRAPWQVLKWRNKDEEPSTSPEVCA